MHACALVNCLIYDPSPKKRESLYFSPVLLVLPGKLDSLVCAKFFFCYNKYSAVEIETEIIVFLRQSKHTSRQMFTK